MAENNNHLLLCNFVSWQFGQVSAGRFLCWSLLGSATCQMLSGSLVESGGQCSLPHRPWLVWVVSETRLSMWSLFPKEASLSFLSQSSKRVAWKLKDLFNYRLVSCTTSLLFVGQNHSHGQAQIQGLFLMRRATRSNCKGMCWDGRNSCSCLCTESTLRVLESSGKKVRSSGRG